MPLGKTIQIYIPDGNPRSIKIADITSRTVQAILLPRPNLEYAITRKELHKVGIYFLINNDSDEEKPIVYIGEAEDCQLLLKQQHKTKDFWNTALVITSKTDYFTKTHVKFLEWHCYSEIEKAGRYLIENSTMPTKPFIPESIISDLLDNFDTIKILTSTLG
ncbi:MAG: GIY-YIG nuclease family protein, partial [Dehalococcoidales bacterium]|nr:GIY-YIG nuclease family protein [Dehalococcoidales bacterium]